MFFCFDFFLFDIFDIPLFCFEDYCFKYTKKKHAPKNEIARWNNKLNVFENYSMNGIAEMHTGG